MSQSQSQSQFMLILSRFFKSKWFFVSVNFVFSLLFFFLYMFVFYSSSYVDFSSDTCVVGFVCGFFLHSLVSLFGSSLVAISDCFIAYLED